MSVGIVCVVRMGVWLWVFTFHRFWVVVSWKVGCLEHWVLVVQVVVWVDWVNEWSALWEQLSVEQLVLAVEDTGVPQVVQNLLI